MRTLARRTLERSGRWLEYLGRAISPTPQERRVVPWFEARGDSTHRLDYDLGGDAIVFDLGGHEGQWTSDIFARFCCEVHVFEPVPEFAAGIERRFSSNPRIHVHRFGLADRTGTADLAVKGDGSSLYGTGEEVVEIRLMRAADFFEENGLTCIDLMKINIEGGEYDLLEHLIETGHIRVIRDIQVQFHDFVADAQRRMDAIHSKLRETHSPTYQYPFVWENWRSRAR